MNDTPYMLVYRRKKEDEPMLEEEEKMPKMS